MRKVLFAMMAAMTVFMVSCEPDNTVEIPTVSFAVQPVNTDGVFTLTLMTTGYNGTDPVTVPLTFSGNAEKGVDYSVSDEAFIIGGATPVTTITVTTLTTAEDMSVTATLSAPDGFQLGNLSEVSFDLTPVTVYATFSRSSMIAMDNATVTVQMYDDKGALKRMDRPISVEFEVVEDESTAERGVNFEFAEGKESVEIGARELDASFVVNRLQYEEGKDKLVLRLKESETVHLGDNYKIEITFAGPIFEKLDGEWVIKELITDQDYFIGQYFDQYYTGIDKVPVFNENDRMTFDLSAGTFTPAFESSFKDYFIGVSNINQGYYYNKETSGENFNGEVLLVELDNVNRYFSSSDVSEDKVAYVGVNFITDEETGEELLDFYVLDFVSHSFFPEMEEFGMYVDEKPTSPWTYLEMTFKRAE